MLLRWTQRGRPRACVRVPYGVQRNHMWRRNLRLYILIWATLEMERAPCDLLARSISVRLVVPPRGFSIALAYLAHADF